MPYPHIIQNKSTPQYPQIFYTHNIKYKTPLSLLLLYICLTVIAAGYYYYQANRHVAFAQTQSPTSDYQIIYTDQGFKPSVLEIPLGASVTFTNASQIPMWPASDPHPTHTDNTGFDAKKDYVPGQTYIYQFTTAGTFGFHNHELSLHRGAIRVVNPSHPLPDINKTKQGQLAYRDMLLNLLKPTDPNSIATVITTIQSNPMIAKDCHDMAHDVGHQAYQLYGFSTAMTLSDGDKISNNSADDMCAGGYMHGILEELFLLQPQLKTNPQSICSTIPEINRGSCFHGVGHGLMFVNVRNVPLSLEGCRKISPNEDMYRCFEGVWMEMFWGATNHVGANSLGWTLNAPLTICKNAATDEKPTCFLYAHLGYLRNHRGDMSKLVSFCTQNNLTDTDSLFCIKGVGITVMKHFTSRHLDQSEALVSGLNDQQKYAYYEGVIGYSRLSDVSDQNLSIFCNQLKTDSTICASVLKNNSR